MDSRTDIRAWRRAQRELLLERRLAVPAAEREAEGTRIVQQLLAIADELATHCIGYYRPFKGEFDLHGLIAQLLARGATAALPVVTEKNQAMVFHSWRQGEKLVHGIWNIPVPAAGAVVAPTLLLVPLVGFDPAGYRLGYGGGYYDRTLAQLVPRTLAIGIGYAAGHDLPAAARCPDGLVADRGGLVSTGLRDTRGANAHAGRRVLAVPGERSATLLHGLAGTRRNPCAARRTAARGAGRRSRRRGDGAACQGSCCSPVAECGA